MSKNSKRRKKRPSEPVFKPYNQHQLMLLPPSLEELIPPHHLVRVINKVVEKLDIRPILSTYKGGGTSSYHPLMLLKVVLYAYVEGIYTPRRIAKALRENVNFMWLSGMNSPDFRTLNNFRSGRLKEHIDSIFASLLLLLIEEGYVDLEQYFVDGSKFMANAGRYSYVWKKNVKRYKKKVLEKIEAILAQIDRSIAEENRRYGEKDLPETGEHAQMDSRRLEETVSEMSRELQQIDSPQEEERDSESGSSDRIDHRLQECENRLQDMEEGPQKRKSISLLRQVRGKLLPRLRHYEHQEQILGNRNSYSKSDEGASFFRYWGDVLLPSYNILMSSQNQFILNYSVHQNFADNVCFIDHMNKFYHLNSAKPGAVIADAGFGSEENYRHLQEQGIEGYLKFPGFDKKRSSRKSNPYRRDNFTYDEERDIFICPEGRELHFIGKRERKNATGYIRQIHQYRCVSCEGCAVRRQCAGEYVNRTVEISPPLERYRRQAREQLTTEKGRQLLRRRGAEIEAIFGQIKHNRNYSRFLLRGPQKVNIEVGLLSIAHNIAKIFRMQQQICPA